MRQIWAFYVILTEIPNGLLVRCPPFDAHFRGTTWSSRAKQRRCTGTNDADSTAKAKNPGLKSLKGAYSVS